MFQTVVGSSMYSTYVNTHIYKNSIICTPYFSSQLYYNNVLIEPNNIVKFSQEKLPSDITNTYTFFVIEVSVIVVISLREGYFHIKN
jgi:hypothetical protein